jgi:hypothetical protein
MCSREISRPFWPVYVVILAVFVHFKFPRGQGRLKNISNKMFCLVQHNDKLSKVFPLELEATLQLLYIGNEEAQ